MSSYRTTDKLSTVKSSVDINDPLSAAPEAAALSATQKVLSEVAKVVKDKSDVIRLLLAALFARGHVLIEDVPGVGKTTLGRSLAACIGGKFSRIQFTADLLPADILGISVFDQRTADFQFKKGPIFANVVLADEINRTAPRTQSALMEVLNEGQVTIDGQTYPLNLPFMVIATQNPVEHFGTYPLPESQMDRFLLRIHVGYPSFAEERKIISEFNMLDVQGQVTKVLTHQEIFHLQKRVDQVRVDESLVDYVMNVVSSSRQSAAIELGVSTRGAIAWHRCARAHALTHGRMYCIPDDFKDLAVPCLAHRIVVQTRHGGAHDNAEEAEHVLMELLDRIEIPM